MTLEEIKRYICLKRPVAAYLGRMEMKAMKDEARKAGYSVSLLTSEPDVHRLEYGGCPLFVVDSESHVGFGHKPEH